MDKYRIANFLDEPTRILVFTLDEVALALPCLLIGFFVIDMPLLSCLVASGLIFLLKKFKGRYGRGYMLFMLYWHLPNVVPTRVTPPSYIREYIA